MKNTLTSFCSSILLGTIICSCSTIKPYSGHDKKPIVNVVQKRLPDNTYGNVLTKDDRVLSSLSEFLPAFVAPDIPYFYIVKNNNVLGGEFLFYGDRENDCIREVLYLSEWVGYYEDIIEKTFYFSPEERTLTFLVTMHEKPLDNKKMCVKRTYVINEYNCPTPTQQEIVPWKRYKKIKRTTKKQKNPSYMSSGFFYSFSHYDDTIYRFFISSATLVGTTS